MSSRVPGATWPLGGEKSDQNTGAAATSSLTISPSKRNASFLPDPAGLRPSPTKRSAEATMPPSNVNPLLPPSGLQSMPHALVAALSSSQRSLTAAPDPFMALCPPSVAETGQSYHHPGYINSYPISPPFSPHSAPQQSNLGWSSYNPPINNLSPYSGLNSSANSYTPTPTYAPYFNTFPQSGPWIPSRLDDLRPLSRQQHFIPEVVPDTCSIEITMPTSSSTPHLADPLSVELPTVPIGYVKDFSASTESEVYDYSVAEVADQSIWYPLGDCKNGVRLGFCDQVLPRNFQRSEDISDCFKDGKCPFADCDRTYPLQTAPSRLRTHLVRHHWAELSPSLMNMYSQAEFARDLMAVAEEGGFSPLIFDRPQFRNFVLKYTNMTPISGRSIMQRSDLLNQDCLNEIKVLLKSALARQFFLTVGEWKSGNQESYLGILVLFIDPKARRMSSDGAKEVKMQVKRRLIGYRKVQAGDALEPVLLEALHQVDLTENDVSGFISDNCNVMKSLFSSLTRLRIPCLAHIIQSSVETLWTPKSRLGDGPSHSFLATTHYAVFQLSIRRLVDRIRTLFVWIRAVKPIAMLLLACKSKKCAKPSLLFIWTTLPVGIRFERCLAVSWRYRRHLKRCGCATARKRKFCCLLPSPPTSSSGSSLRFRSS